MFTPTHGKEARFLAPRADYELVKMGYTDGEPIKYWTFE